MFILDKLNLSQSVKPYLTWSSGVFILLLVILLMHALEGQGQLQE